MSKSPKRRLTQRPGFAAVLLLAGAGTAWNAFGRTDVDLGAQTAAVAEAVGDMFALDEADEPVVDGEGVQGLEPGRDLVAEFGVASAILPLPRLFDVAPEPVTVPAAPVAESAAIADWHGTTPPAHVVGVVMVGDASRRAVVDGRVVGIGDRLADSQILAIEPSSVIVTWQGRRLTYGLQSPVPCEFRAEHDKRSAKATEESPENPR
jgi:hypothetical protein